MFNMSLLTNVENVTPVKNLTFVDATSIFGPNRDSLFIVIPITIIYSLIFVTGLLGNIFTCLVIVRNKSMHTATNYYLFSLAISDLLLLISGMPQEMYSIWSKWPYIFGHSFCVIRGLAAETSTNASVLTITLFTVERYLAICHPFVSHKMSKLSRATKHVMLLWVVALALALPQALQFGVKNYEGVTMCLQTRIIIEHSFEISTFFVFFAPMVLITVLYSLIGLKLRETNINKEQSQKDFERSVKNTHKIRRQHSQSTRRVVKMLVAVVVTFFICWAPFHAQRLVAIYGTNEDHLAKSPILLSVYSFMTYTSGVFYYISTCINPIFYHIMSNKFRGAFKNTVAEWCCRSSNSASGKRCSYTVIGIQRNPSSIEKMKRQDSREKTIPTVQICHNGISIPISPRHEDKNNCYDYKHVPIEEMKNIKNHNLETHLLVNVVQEKPRSRSPVSYPIPAEIITISPDAAASDEKKDYNDEPEKHIKEIKLRITLSEKEYG